MDKTPGAKVSHATIGVVYAMSAHVQGDITNKLKLGFDLEKAPYLKADLNVLPNELKEAFEAFQKMAEDMVGAIKGLPDLQPKAEALAGEAKELPGKAKEEMQKANKSPKEIMDALSAIKKNCAHVANMPNLIKDTGNKLKNGSVELVETVKALNQEKEDIKKKGEELAKSGKKSPKDCYIAAKGEIPMNPNETKQWEKKQAKKAESAKQRDNAPVRKPRAAAAAPAAPAEKKEEDQKAEGENKAEDNNAAGAAEGNNEEGGDAQNDGAGAEGPAVDGGEGEGEGAGAGAGAGGEAGDGGE